MKQQTDANFQMDIRTLAQVDDDPEKIRCSSGRSLPLYLYRGGAGQAAQIPAEWRMIIYNTGLGSKPFYDSVVAELKQVFPEQPLQSWLRITRSSIPFRCRPRGVHQAVGASGYRGDEPWFDGSR